MVICCRVSGISVSKGSPFKQTSAKNANTDASSFTNIGSGIIRFGQLRYAPGRGELFDHDIDRRFVTLGGQRILMGPAVYFACGRDSAVRLTATCRLRVGLVHNHDSAATAFLLVSPPNDRIAVLSPSRRFDLAAKSGRIHGITCCRTQTGKACAPVSVEDVHPEFANRLADDRRKRDQAVGSIGSRHQAKLQGACAIADQIAARSALPRPGQSRRREWPGRDPAGNSASHHVCRL